MDDILLAIGYGGIAFCTFMIGLSLVGLVEQIRSKQNADVRTFDEFLRGHR